ncbi:MAG: hypothetical protein ACR652_20680 [Methylocystis sp.]|uniref:hypothetical protein n=1 Tax=Methylocystis sp. TaxID=1911079 RepID=UPI003DA68283
MANLCKSGVIARMRNAPAHVAVPVGALFIIGGFLSILPVFGLWMFPVGLAIIAPHIPAAGRLERRLLRWSIRKGFLRIKRVKREEPDVQ